MNSERYVIDMTWLSKMFKKEVMAIIVPVDQYATEMTPSIWQQYQGTTNFVYQESVTQMFLILTTDMHDFMSKLDVVLDMNYFMHIPAVMEQENVMKFKQLFKSIAFHLAMYLRDTIPNTSEGEKAEYLLENLTDSYALVTKYYNER